jgi:DNA-binding winged helix-turn-helix (wHTH) protein
LVTAYSTPTGERSFVLARLFISSPKAFQLLTVLTDARPRAISKDELQETLWPDTFVSEANLAGLINEVRTGIGDSARSARYIKTLHGFGDSFGGALQEKSGWLVNLATEPRLDPLRDEPRFTALLTAVNLAHSLSCLRTLFDAFAGGWSAVACRTLGKRHETDSIEKPGRFNRLVSSDCVSER